jgi:haloalkane dehalogenase
VLHDWGGFIGMSYLADHPAHVRALVLMEAVVRPMRSSDRSEAFNRAFGMMRSEAGRLKVLSENFFVERILPGSVLRELTPAEMEAYRAPFPTEASRLPTWVFPNEIPIDGHPSDVAAALWEIGTRVAAAKAPTLLLTFEPGAILGPVEVAWCMEHFPGITVEHLGPGVHFVQEDQPAAIGRTIAAWLEKLQ